MGSPSPAWPLLGPAASPAQNQDTSPTMAWVWAAMPSGLLGRILSEVLAHVNLVPGQKTC